MLLVRSLLLKRLTDSIPGPLNKLHGKYSIFSQFSARKNDQLTGSYDGRTETMVGPRFEQTAQEFQPRPLAAIELIAEQPIRLVESRTATCDGGTYSTS